MLAGYDVPYPLLTDGLESAFVAFGVVGSDEENQTLILRLMHAITAYLRAQDLKELGDRTVIPTRD